MAIYGHFASKRARRSHPIAVSSLWAMLLFAYVWISTDIRQAVHNQSAPYMAIYGPYMVIFGYISSYMGIYGPYMAIYGSYMDHIWTFMGHMWAIYGHIWRGPPSESRIL